MVTACHTGRLSHPSASLERVVYRSLLGFGLVLTLAIAGGIAARAIHGHDPHAGRGARGLWPGGHAHPSSRRVGRQGDRCCHRDDQSTAQQDVTPWGHLSTAPKSRRPDSVGRLRTRGRLPRIHVSSRASSNAIAEPLNAPRCQLRTSRMLGARETGRRFWVCDPRSR